MRRARIKGPRTVTVQGIPAQIMARVIRLGRGMPSTYYHPDWVRRGWVMRHYRGEAEKAGRREAYRQAMIWDHQHDM